MSRHTITHADEIFIGDPVALGFNGAKRGIEMMPIHQQVIENPLGGDLNGMAESQAVAAAGNLTLDGAFVTDGVAILDFARNVEIVSDNAGDGSQVARITGTDIVGNLQVEDLTFNGTTPVSGAKAFKTVTQIAIDAALAGNAIAGTPLLAVSTRLGLDAGLESLFDAIHALTGVGTPTEEGGTFIVADLTSPATATTGDTKGTYTPNTVPDGILDYILWYHPVLTKESYGDNFTG